VPLLRAEPPVFALVDKVGGYYDSEDDSDSEDESSTELETGKVNVVIAERGFADETSGAVTVDRSSLVVVDREFVPDSVVARADNPQGISGVILNMKVSVDICSLANKQIARNISSEVLGHPHLVRPETYVVYREWLCQVVACSIDIKIQLQNGSVCWINNADSHAVFPIGRLANLTDDQVGNLRGGFCFCHSLISISCRSPPECVLKRRLTV